jgi:hypothetical protein
MAYVSSACLPPIPTLLMFFLVDGVVDFSQQLLRPEMRGIFQALKRGSHQEVGNTTTLISSAEITCDAHKGLYSQFSTSATIMAREHSSEGQEQARMGKQDELRRYTIVCILKEPSQDGTEKHR